MLLFRSIGQRPSCRVHAKLVVFVTIVKILVGPFRAPASSRERLPDDKVATDAEDKNAEFDLDPYLVDKLFPGKYRNANVYLDSTVSVWRRPPSCVSVVVNLDPCH